MKKNKIKTGSIIKIKLEHKLGFVLAKLINLNELKEKPIYNELIYVYNRIFTDENIDIDKIDPYELLLGPLFVLDLPPVVRNKTWEVLGHMEPNPKELTIPDFKDFGPVLAVSEVDAKIWYYLRGLEINKRVVTDYDKVKHLEIFKIYSHDMVARRLTMEILRNMGKEIKDYYEIKNWNELSLYNHILFTPIYSSIPEEIRGRAIQ